MKKIFVGLLAFIFICALILFVIRDRYSITKILSNFEEQTGTKIELQGENNWIFYPSITFSNSNVMISQNKNSLRINNAKIFINKSYWPTSPIYLKLTSPSASYEGMGIRALILDAKYNSNIINVEKFSGNIIEGNIRLTGQLDLDDTQYFNFQGQFNNISFNTLLKQAEVATWERVNLKLSSPDFTLSGQGKSGKVLLDSLTGNIPITGSFYLTSSEEERFGAALLSLLVEKIPNLSSVSKSINFLLTKYANIPSSLKGTLIVKNGLIQSNEILIFNNEANASVTGFYNFLNDTIDGKIYFYDQNEIFLEASLKGKIKNPQILVGGKVFTDNEGKQIRDIKQLFEQGINSLLDKLLKKND